MKSRIENEKEKLILMLINNIIITRIYETNRESSNIKVDMM